MKYVNKYKKEFEIKIDDTIRVDDRWKILCKMRNDSNQYTLMLEISDTVVSGHWKLQDKNECKKLLECLAQIDIEKGNLSSERKFFLSSDGFGDVQNVSIDKQYINKNFDETLALLKSQVALSQKKKIGFK